MAQFLKNFFEKFLLTSKSYSFKSFLLKALYKRKGMLFHEYKKIGNFYIFHVDNFFIPSEKPFWNICFAQSVTNSKLISLFQCELEQGDVVIDFGAGIGEEVIPYREMIGSSGKLYCLEPLPEALEVLGEVVKLNKYTNVEVLPYALYSNNERISIKQTAEYDATYVAGDNEGGVFVQGVRFDSLMEKLSQEKIKFIKVNIEGAERFLLDVRFIPYFQKIQHFAIACHDFRYKKEKNDFFKTKAEVVNFFKKNNFKVSTQNTGEDWIDDWVYVVNLNKGTENEVPLG